jgi:primosomal protein N' (replication factor Y)
MQLVEVLFNLPVSHGFAYAVPDGVEAVPGTRVIAPLGSRSLVGYLLGPVDEPPPGVREVKPLKRVVDSRPIFDEGILELARWVAEMYLCSVGEALSAMLPGGRREREPEELGGSSRWRGRSCLRRIRSGPWSGSAGPRAVFSTSTA